MWLRQAFWIVLLCGLTGARSAQAGCDVPATPGGVVSVGLERANEVYWQPVAANCAVTYTVERSAAAGGPFAAIATGLDVPHYADPQPVQRVRYYYRVVADTSGGSSSPSLLTSVVYNGLTDDALLDLIQAETFKYFWDYGHPHSGLARESFNLGHGSDTCAAGATGMGVLTLIVGAERGFASRTDVAARLLRIVRFLDGVDPDVPTQSSGVQRYHGAWSHWIHGQSGATIPFAGFQDDGGDLVETMLLMQGLLTARKYFDGNGPVESEMRARITDMWRTVEWDWYERFPGSNVLYWHWSPNHGWALNLPIRGYHEGQLVYVMAVASPTHAMPPAAYSTGWTGLGSYANGQTLYGETLDVGPSQGGPLFLTQYSYMGMDPRYQRDAFANYAVHAAAVARAQQGHAIANPNGFGSYSALAWGLTSSDGPAGYNAHSIGNDTGTITPTAALSSMPFTPDASLRALRYMYDRWGASLLGSYGFRDAFNPGQSWFSVGHLGIDQGPIVPMIENHRTGLCWRFFMQNARIQTAMFDCGFHFEVDFDQDDDVDAGDASVFLDCMSGPAPAGMPAGCSPALFSDADLTNDTGVDLRDVAILQRLVQ